MRNSPKAPAILHVRFVDTFAREVGVLHLGTDAEPIKRRVVSVDLTDAQRDALRPAKVGESGGESCFEAWEVVALEPAQ